MVPGMACWATRSVRTTEASAVACPPPAADWAAAPPQPASTTAARTAAATLMRRGTSSAGAGGDQGAAHLKGRVALGRRDLAGGRRAEPAAGVGVGEVRPAVLAHALGETRRLRDLLWRRPRLGGVDRRF